MILKNRRWLLSVLFALFAQQAVIHAYEPTYNEILIQKERLESFCSLKDNQRRFQICETFESMKGRLPDRISDMEIFRQAYEQRNGKKKQ